MDAGGTLPCETEFEANEDYCALQQARKLTGHRPADLWRDGQRIARIREMACGMWTIERCEDLPKR
ncbi:hypothetical protein D6201_08775 [Aurantiacibacter aquimixticola]|uniref:Uncharacterized protein n=2 Tax=Aurantiacibacter aquimixticola TaxID=1958945 RepID=A0A419RUG9_9SPHN|nr:hypothetical protein D6201_08775 [Aurantiacibacter aquimixticola]